MKRMIIRRLCAVIVIAMAAVVCLTWFIQTKAARDLTYSSALIQLRQIDKTIQDNDSDLKQLEESIREDYFIRAKAAAYMIQTNPGAVEDLAQMCKIAGLLQIDELHVFDKEGVLYAGTDPKYYGYTFRSGEQMEFFLPMLEDTSLELCQEITPNTAEGRLMQYLAVWREDKEEIIQIGMEPMRLMDAMQRNDLSYIFDMIPTEEGVTLFALDPETELILGATDKALDGKKASEIGLAITDIDEDVTVTTKAVLGGLKVDCVLMKTGSVLSGICYASDVVYSNLYGHMGLIVLSMSILGTVIIFLIYRVMERNVIREIYQIIDGTKQIAAGDLDERIADVGIPEFVQLGSDINHMVERLLENTGKLSWIFEGADIPMASFECHRDMKRVLATDKLGELLGITEEETEYILSDRSVFEAYLKKLFSRAYSRDVYLLPGNRRRYVKYKCHQEKDVFLGVIMDVTEDVEEKQRIEQERDVDILTGLSSRRAFFTRMDHLFEQPEKLGTAVILMADLDKLKMVNDTYGHRYGDRILKEAALLFQECSAPNKVAARLSGDEFVLFLYGAGSKEELQSYLDEIVVRMQQTEMKISEEVSVPVGLSGGYIFYPSSFGSEYRDLLRLADQALYLAKKTQRRTFIEYEREDTSL